MKARHKDTGEIIELAEEGIISRDGRKFCWYQVELIPEPIDECKLSLPSNLDEAAEEYAYNNWEDNDYHTGASEGLPFDAIGHTEKCFKAGAEWMAGQGVTVKGLLYGGSLGIPDIPEEFYTDKEEEVIVQIRKK